MRRSLRAALLFAGGAFVIDALVACWILDTYRHVPLPPFVKFFFYVGLWPSLLVQRSPLQHIDAAIFSPLVWGIIGFSLAVFCQKDSVVAHQTSNQSVELTATRRTLTSLDD